MKSRIRSFFIFAIAVSAATAATSSKVPDTVPKDVECNKIEKCDKHGVCAIVCERGSVGIPPWLEEALSLQRRLAYTENICRAQLPGSHNSGITLADGYGVEDHVFEEMLRFVEYFDHPSYARVRTNDQYFSLTDQLRLGVRLIEIDVHWFDGDLRVAHCGGFHSGFLDGLVDDLNRVAKLLGKKIRWDSETMGCKPSMSSIPADEQRRLEDALVEIGAWLDRNPEEFLIVFFDDASDLFKWNKVKKLVGYIKKHFPAQRIYAPPDVVDPHHHHNNATITDGEGTPSLASLIARGKRIVFLTGADYGKESQAVMFHKDNVCHWQENPGFPFEPYPSCRFTEHPDASPLNGTILRPETSEIQYGILNAEGKFGPNHNVLDEKSLPPLTECAVNLPSPDNLTPKRMESMVWTVKRPGTTIDATKCIASTTTAGWANHPCHRECGVACRRASHSGSSRTEWHIGRPAVAEPAAACPRGFVFGAPVNGFENRLLAEAMISSSAQGEEECVWLNVRGVVGSDNQTLSSLS